LGIDLIRRKREVIVLVDPVGFQAAINELCPTSLGFYLLIGKLSRIHDNDTGHKPLTIAGLNRNSLILEGINGVQRR
jgi:hypothetical protein